MGQAQLKAVERRDIKDKKLAGYIDKIMAEEDKRNQINGTIKSIYHDAEEAGYPKDDLRTTIKAIKKPKSKEHMVNVNRFLEDIGQLPLFAHVDLDEAGTDGDD